MASRLRRWPMEVLTALDRLANAALLGDSRLTISARAYWARESRDWWSFVADIIDWIALRVFGQTDHCRRAAEFDGAVRRVMEEADAA